jgi:pantoate--beta-alanine ligase
MHLTRPQLAYFGQKDAQQLLLIRRMVDDLDLGVEVVAVPTVREPDGLAMSSRNTYLTPFDREVALALSRALRAGETAAPEGATAVRRAARDVLVREPLLLVDYLVLVHPVTLDDVPDWYRGEALLAVAAKVGTTRLIDNLPLVVGQRA